MARFDATSAECLVFTYKDGLLSKLGHDLKLRVTEFALTVDPGGALSATFDAASLRVVSAVKDGTDQPHLLTEADKSKIASQITSKVLRAKRHPEIAFTSSSVTARDDGGYDIEGALTLRGTTRSVTLSSRREGDAQVAELRLHQPDYGISPYKAAMGTLKVKPEVRVCISVPILEAPNA